MAAGRPVVASAAGGALETVADGRTGMLFEAATPGALASAIERLEGTTLDPAVAHAWALRFDRWVFAERSAALLTKLGLEDLASSVDWTLRTRATRARARSASGRSATKTTVPLTSRYTTPEKTRSGRWSSAARFAQSGLL